MTPNTPKMPQSLHYHPNQSVKTLMRIDVRIALSFLLPSLSMADQEDWLHIIIANQAGDVASNPKPEKQ